MPSQPQQYNEKIKKHQKLIEKLKIYQLTIQSFSYNLNLKMLGNFLGVI
jgi:hypothetical protein